MARYMSNKIMTRFCGIRTGFLRFCVGKRVELEHRLVPNEVTARCQGNFGSYHTALRVIVTLLLIMVVGGVNVWGQSTGIYYIANNNTNAYELDSPTNWYMVPASDNGEANVPISDWTWNDEENTPLVTTFQTRKDENSVWAVIKNGSNNDYYFVHVLSGKYMTLNNGVGTNSNRRTFHMESATSPDDSHLFKFSAHSGTPQPYSIYPKNKTSEYMYLNPSNGNKPRYYAYETSDGDYKVGGTIGLFNKNATGDAGSKWFLEAASKLSAPTIEYDSGNDKFTISYDKIPAGFEILYTTDGNDPTIGGATTHSYTNESGITLATIGSNPLKAVVTRYGLILTETAIIRKPSNPTITPTPGDCNNTVTISTEEGTSVYYTIDGTPPTNSSTLYTGPFVLNSDATIQAVSYSGNLHSEVISLDYTPNYSNKPAITQNGATITIEGTGTIYYTTNGSDPNTGSTLYNSPFTLSGNSGDVITIKAVAKDGDKELSCVVEKAVKMGYFISNLSQLEAISSHPSDLCILTADIDASALSASISNFTGEFDGDYYTISGLKKPLFDNLNGATVKNVLLDPNATVSGNGAICNEADGSTKIYNCGVLSGEISGSGNVGGLVGHIASGSSVRVVNCYNFAKVSGGTTMAGIVGNNEGTVGDVRIALCMMYGDMPSGTSPVYAGNHTSNVSNFNEYNYWRSKAALTYSTYNDQLAIDKDDYLTRFPFYRHILNSHRELAAYFLFGDYTSEHVNEIGHWAIDNSKAIYPIVQRWDTNTKKVLDAPAGSTVNVRKGEGSQITSLAVTVKIGSHTYNRSLPITDMDEANHDYTWGKVVLPFANEFEVNTDYDHICTGWKITGITGGTTGTSFNKYDVSDRDCTSKDLYSTTGFVFAQGGNYIVPYNVTKIEITANFATAYYLSDEAYDIGYSGDKTGNNVSGYKGRIGLGGDTPSTFHNRTVYHTLKEALGVMTNSGTTHSQAVVLVGNYHQDDEDLSDHTAKGLTIMSIDADNNQEPDYAWYSNNTQDRPAIPPTRFDFIALIPVGMSSRVNNSTFYPGIPIWKPCGWFEMTETSLSKMDQFELNSNNFNTSNSDTRNYRCIINGGYFTQMVRSRKAACNNVKYYQIGGKAYVKEFYPGSHSADSYGTVLCPINVTGGEIEQCFMTGFGKGTAIGPDIFFWCAGGKIDKFLGAYMEKPRQTSSADGNVNLTAKIDHAKIGRFFGGGTSPKAPISGNIDITINNSHVDFYCGGPEFGSMSGGKTVKTSATNTVFEQFYGAGFGGTAITYTNDKDDNTQGIGNTSDSGSTVTYPSSFFTTNYSSNPAQDKGRLKYNSGYGIGSCYKMEFIFNSRGAGSVARFYTGYAQFDLATTGSVTNELTGCTINGDFYGAGCQGKVSGTITSTLTNCTLKRSAFGGGYKAESNEVEIYTTTPPSMSTYTRETGIFSDFGEGTHETYNWAQGDATTQNTVNGTTLYTSKDITMSDLGNVTGAITLTIDGGYVGGTAQGATPEVAATATTDAIPAGGSVYGGGNESKSFSNTTVTLKGDAVIYGNVFGGGNKAEVQGSTEVNIEE